MTSNVLYSSSSEASPYDVLHRNTASNSFSRDTQANPLYSSGGGAADAGTAVGSAVGGVPLTANAMYQSSDSGGSQYSALGTYYSIPDAIGGAESTYAVTGVPMTANVLYEAEGGSSTDAGEAGTRDSYLTLE